VFIPVSIGIKSVIINQKCTVIVKNKMAPFYRPQGIYWCASWQDEGDVGGSNRQRDASRTASIDCKDVPSSGR